MKKKCSKCKNEFDLSCFSSRGNGKKSYYCKECRKVIRKADYEKHKLYYILNAKEVKSARRNFVREAKNKPCTDCGKTYPYYVMDFDHLRDKNFNVNSQATNKGFETLQKEIDKCEVVCSNCHRERTYQRSLTSTVS